MALIVCQAIAQEPAVNTERAKLQFLVGSFATETNIPARPSALKDSMAKGTSFVAWALDTTFLVIDDQSTPFGR